MTQALFYASLIVAVAGVELYIRSVVVLRHAHPARMRLRRTAKIAGEIGYILVWIGWGGAVGNLAGLVFL